VIKLGCQLGTKERKKERKDNVDSNSRIDPAAQVEVKMICGRRETNKKERKRLR